MKKKKVFNLNELQFKTLLVNAGFKKHEKGQRVTPTIPQIQERACEVFGITMEELIGRERPDHIAKPRIMLMAWCSELGFRAGAISKAFNRNHSNIYHARQAKHFTKLELERMEQVKASFERPKRFAIEPKDFIKSPRCPTIPSYSEFETRIECWKPRGNKVA